MKGEVELREEHVIRVRIGHGANCSSLGSVIDTLFGTATVGAAILAAVMAALRSEADQEVPSAEARDLELANMHQGKAQP